MPAYPKNYPFYNWVPKPIGIIILFMFFLPILTVGGTYSASGTEMSERSGHHIRTYPVCQLRHIHRHGGILPFPVPAGMYPQGENDVYRRIFADVYLQLHLRQDRQHIPVGAMQSVYGIPAYGADDGRSVYSHQVCR